MQSKRAGVHQNGNLFKEGLLSASASLCFIPSLPCTGLGTSARESIGEWSSTHRPLTPPSSIVTLGNVEREHDVTSRSLLQSPRVGFRRATQPRTVIDRLFKPVAHTTVSWQMSGDDCFFPAPNTSYLGACLGLRSGYTTVG